VLPEPVIVTNGDGAIMSINSAAASLLGLRIDRLLRRPIQTLPDPHDRPGVRSDLAAAVRSDSEGFAGFRRRVRLHPRQGPPVPVEPLVALDRGIVTGEVEVTWFPLSPQEHAVLTHNPDGAMETARALVELTQLPLQAHEPHVVLTKAAAICRRALGEGVEVSVTVGEPAAPTLLATTSALAQRVDGARMMTGQGL
jgi:hypothetical protein